MPFIVLDIASEEEATRAAQLIDVYLNDTYKVRLDNSIRRMNLGNHMIASNIGLNVAPGTIETARSAQASPRIFNRHDLE